MGKTLATWAVAYLLFVGAVLVFRELVYGGSVHGPAPATESIWYKAD